MPIYEYKCDKCDHIVEKLQRVGDPQPLLCPHCEAPSLSKVISATSFRLKGSGWYETDFKSGRKRNVAGEATNQTPESAAA